MVYPLLRPHNMASSSPRVASAPGFPSTQASCFEAQLEDCPVDTSILWEKPTKDGPQLAMDRSKEERDMVRFMADMVPSCPRTASIPGFPSIHLSKEVKVEREPNMADLMPSCPRVAGTLRFPSLESQVEECTINTEAVKGKEGVTIRSSPHLDRLQEELMKNMVTMELSCPTAASIPGLPSAPHPKAEVELNMLSLVLACPKMSSLPGFAYTDGATALEWLVDPKPMFEHLKKKKEDEENILPKGISKTKARVALVPCWPEEARIPSFRSAPQPKRELNSVDLARSCPKSSSLPGFPSTAKFQTGDWHVEQKPLFEKKLKDKTVIIKDRSPEDRENRVSLAPSCPCESLTSGFPSFTQLKAIEEQTVFSLMRACPSESREPGLPSRQPSELARTRGEESVSSMQPLWEKPLKDNRSEDMVLSKPDLGSAVGDENLKTMLALAPSCPEAASIPGFPSVLPHSPESVEAHGKTCVVKHVIFYFQ